MVKEFSNTLQTYRKRNTKLTAIYFNSRTFLYKNITLRSNYYH